MVKSELISPSTNNSGKRSSNRPGLNPAVFSALVIVVAVIALVFAIFYKQDQPNSPAQNSTPANASAPLSVQPANGNTATQATDNTSVQAAAGATSEQINGQSPLNNTGTTPDASQGTDYNQQTELNNSSLSN